MAKKTWIKVKRGILDPKHRIGLGASWYLYFYMLDKTNWETGKIFEWRDEDASCDLEVPLSTIRVHRRRLEPEYISVLQKHHRQEITIKNWTNPREYSGEIYNKDDDNIAQPLEDEQINDGYINGDNDDYMDGDKNLTPLHLINISHNTVHSSRLEKKSAVSLLLDTLQISIQSEYDRELLKDVLNIDEEKLKKVVNWYIALPDRSYIARKVLGAIQSAAEGWTDIQPKQPRESNEGALAALAEYNKQLEQEEINGK